MNASRHPSIDQIADLDAGVLPATEAAGVSAHVDECSSCRDVVSGLADVTALLADTGHEVLPVPTDVSLAVDAALERARAERQAGVASLSEHRMGSDASDRASASSRRPSGRLLLGAAAAVAVFAVGGALVDQLGILDRSASDSTASSVADQERGGNAGSGSTKRENPGYDTGGTPAPAFRVPRAAAPTLNQNNVAAYAAGLAEAAVPVAKPPSACTPGSDGVVTGAGRAADALVSFDGNRAVLRLDRQNREFTVYACHGPERVLYRSAY